MKSIREIDALLDRYWEGETTLEEERALKTYFASGEVNERHRPVAPLFRALREEQSVQLAARNIPVATLRVQRFSWHGWAAAASAALLLAAGLWWMQRETPVQQQVVQQAPTEQEQHLLPQEKPAQTEMNKEDKAELLAEAKAPVSAKKKVVTPKKTIATTPTPVASTDQESEKAMEEIKAALALVSSKLNKGKREAAKGAVQLENVDKIFIENVDRVFKIKSEG